MYGSLLTLLILLNQTRSKMGNFIDKTFQVLADLLLKLLPASKREKTAFSYYRAGMAAQTRGRYGEALVNYYESLQFEQDAYDRSYTLYNIGLIFGNMGKYEKAIEFYHQALKLNYNLPQALNNIAVIYHSQALRLQTLDDDESWELSKEFLDKAGDYWVQTMLLDRDSYPGARNWLKVTGRYNDEDYPR